MQTTVKHGPGSFVAYVAFGERALEVGLRPFRWAVHSKRTQFSRKKAKAEINGFETVSRPGPTAGVLPGFVEPEHPPQTNTVLSK